MFNKNTLLAATGFIAAGIGLLGCQSKPKAVSSIPSGPVGSVTNPIDLTHASNGWDSSVKQTIVRAYRDSSRQNTIFVKPDGLEHMYALYGGKYVKVPTGDGIERTFAVEGKCPNGVPALELKEDGLPVGNMSPDGSSLNPYAIYVAEPITTLYRATDYTQSLSCR